MKYVIIDLETTGLNHETCQILEIGAVVEDTEKLRPIEELPRFHCYVIHKMIQGEAYALAMHSEILRRIAKLEKPYEYYTPKLAIWKLQTFLNSQFREERYSGDKITVAGKNFSNFDKLFLEKIDFDLSLFHHRVIDPSVYFWDPKLDSKLPSMDQCLERAGIDIRTNHTAIGDCLNIVRLVRAANDDYRAFDQDTND